ncbi:MAG TPA: hypothetical protein VGN69_06135 [Solirubrobacteraceae bacterium]|jgi:hypothetical protein|nr:hypothetical protein [Solirubrobacteraceae bacterium]
MPDPKLTPGAVLPSASPATICRRGYSRRQRNVPVSLKREVYRRYGITYVPRRAVVDHLVPLEIGGANVGIDPATGRVNPTANLWPEPVAGPAGSHQKDGLENYLRSAVCTGRMSLRAAQMAIASDWYSAWLQAGQPAP